MGSYAINDMEMFNVIVDDLVEQRGYMIEEAKEWAKENGSLIISNMWDEYSAYIEEYALYKKEMNSELDL